MRRERVGGDGFAVLLAGFTALLASHRVEPDKTGRISRRKWSI